MKSFQSFKSSRLSISFPTVPTVPMMVPTSSNQIGNSKMKKYLIARPAVDLISESQVKGIRVPRSFFSSSNQEGQKLIEDLKLNTVFPVNEVSSNGLSLTEEILKEEARKNPFILFGWQIKLLSSSNVDNSSNPSNPSNPSNQNGVYIITGAKKGLVSRKQLFRISCKDHSDQWIALQLNHNKPDRIPFKLQKKVIYFNHDDETEPIKH